MVLNMVNGVVLPIYNFVQVVVNTSVVRVVKLSLLILKTGELKTVIGVLFHILVRLTVIKLLPLLLLLLPLLPLQLRRLPLLLPLLPSQLLPLRPLPLALELLLKVNVPSPLICVVVLTIQMLQTVVKKVMFVIEDTRNSINVFQMKCTMVLHHHHHSMTAVLELMTGVVAMFIQIVVLQVSYVP